MKSYDVICQTFKLSVEMIMSDRMETMFSRKNILVLKWASSGYSRCFITFDDCINELKVLFSRCSGEKIFVVQK